MHINLCRASGQRHGIFRDQETLSRFGRRVGCGRRVVLPGRQTVRPYIMTFPSVPCLSMSLFSFRYVHLCMYVLPFQVEALAVSRDGKQICAVGIQYDPDPVMDISILKIPDKVLTSDPTLEGYFNGRDFSVQAGVRKTMLNAAPDELKIKSVSPYSNHEVPCTTYSRAFCVSHWRRPLNRHLLVMHIGNASDLKLKLKQIFDFFQVWTLYWARITINKGLCLVKRSLLGTSSIKNKRKNMI